MSNNVLFENKPTKQSEPTKRFRNGSAGDEDLITESNPVKTSKHFLISKSSLNSNNVISSGRKIIVNGQQVISVIMNSADNLKSLFISDDSQRTSNGIVKKLTRSVSQYFINKSNSFIKKKTTNINTEQPIDIGNSYKESAAMISESSDESQISVDQNYDCKNDDEGDMISTLENIEKNLIDIDSARFIQKKVNKSNQENLKLKQLIIRFIKKLNEINNDSKSFEITSEEFDLDEVSLIFTNYLKIFQFNNIELTDYYELCKNLNKILTNGEFSKIRLEEYIELIYQMKNSCIELSERKMEIEKLKENLKNSQKLNEETNHEYEKYLNLFEEEEKKREILMMEISKLEKKTLDNNIIIAEKETLIEELKNSIKNLSVKIQKMDKNEKELQIDIKLLNDNNNGLISTNKNLKIENKKLRDELEAKINKRNEENIEYEEKIKSLNGKIQEMERSIANNISMVDNEFKNDCLPKSMDNLSCDEIKEDYSNESIHKTSSIFFEENNKQDQVKSGDFFILKSCGGNKEEEKKQNSKCQTEGCNGKGNTRIGKKSHSSTKYCPNAIKDNPSSSSSDDCLDNLTKKTVRKKSQDLSAKIEEKNSIIDNLNEEFKNEKLKSNSINENNNQLRNQLEQLRIDLSNKNESENKLKQEINKMNEELSKEKQSNSDLNKKFNDLNIFKNNLEKKAKELEEKNNQLKEKNDSLIRELNKLKTELDNEKKITTDLKSKVNELNSIKDELNQKNSDLKTQVDELIQNSNISNNDRNEFNSLKEKLEKNSSELISEKNKNKISQKKISDLEISIEQLKHQLEQLRNDITIKNDNENKLNQQIKKINEELCKEKKSNSDLINQLNDSSANKNDLEKRIKECEEIVLENNNMKDQSQKKINDLELKIDQLNDQLKQENSTLIQNEIDRVNNLLRNEKNNVLAFKQKFEELESFNTKLKIENHHLNNVIENLNQQKTYFENDLNSKMEKTHCDFKEFNSRKILFEIEIKNLKNDIGILNNQLKYEMEKSEIYDKKNNELIIENNSIKWNQTKIDNFIHKIDSHINRVKNENIFLNDNANLNKNDEYNFYLNKLHTLEWDINATHFNMSIDPFDNYSKLNNKLFELIKEINIEKKNIFSVLINYLNEKKMIENKFTNELNMRDQRITNLENSLKFSEQIKLYLNSQLKDSEIKSQNLRNNNQNNYNQNTPYFCQNNLIGFVVSKGSSNGLPVYRGARGGKYYINKNNNKSYIGESPDIRLI